MKFRNVLGLWHLKTNLPSLIAETGDRKKVRYNYYETLLQFLPKTGAGRCLEYCERHGMLWTGALLGTRMAGIPDQCPDNIWPCTVWPQIPAIDMLYNDFFLRPRYN